MTLDPLDPKRIAPLLPSLQEEQKKKKELEHLFNKTNRSGAGSTYIPGAPAIRPSGSLDSFREAITPGKLPKRDPLFSKPLEVPKNAHNTETGFRLKIMLPRTFCPDCDKTDRPEEGGAVNINIFMEEKHSISVKPGDALISFFCQACCNKFTESQKGVASDLSLVTSSGGIAKKKEIDAAERLVRIKANTEAYIRCKLLTNDTGIFVNGI